MNSAADKATRGLTNDHHNLRYQFQPTQSLMKIGIDATALTHPQPTGVEIVTRELIKALLASDLDNQYILYSPTLLGREWQKYSNSTNRVLPPASWWVVRRLSRAIPEDNLDVFWSPSNFLPYNLPAKSLTTVHDLAFVHFPQAYSWKSRLLSWLTVRRAAAVATKILAVSEQTSRDLISRFNISPARVAVIPNALPDRPTDQLIYQRSIPNEYLLVVGRVEARKNPLIIIKAFALIASDFPELQLVFAGSDGYRAEQAKKLAAKVGLSSRIHFLGFVSEIRLRELYAYASVVVFPSLYEGFGLPVLEAFHYGVPLIASHTPAVAEVAGDAALLVEPTDALGFAQAIDRLISTPELRAQLIEKGALRLQQFSWEASAKALKDVINSLNG